MYSQLGIGSANPNDSANRMYRIEVEGMGQNTDPDRVSYRIRSTGKTYITVAYDRMSEQMRRINRMGGKILSIEPLSAEGEHAAKKEVATTNPG